VAQVVGLSKRRLQSNGSYSKRVTLPERALHRLGIEKGDSIGATYLPSQEQVRLGPGHDEFELEVTNVGGCTGITMPAAVCFEHDLGKGDVVVVSCVDGSLRLRF